jgi:capsular exopolysaccharide synthesis family protein
MSELRPENLSSSPSGASTLSTNYLRILREQWFVVALCFLLCVGGGLIGRNLVPTKYHAQADLLISPIDIADNTYVGVSVFRSISSDPTSNVLTLSRYLDTPETAAIVKQRLHLSESPDALLNSISVQPLSQTSIVSVESSASTPALARDIADGFVDATLTRRTKQVQSDVNTVIARLQQQIAKTNPKATASIAPLQTRLAALRSLIGLPDPTVSVLNRAQTPTAPAKPSASLVVIATALAGLLLGFGAALFIDSVGGKLRREDDLLVRDRLPILARVPRMTDTTLRAYFGGRSNLPPSAWEAYRTLRTNILRSPHSTEQTPVVLVTSAMTGEGKTLTAVNLAVTLAAQNMQVLLVDGDFRRPMIAGIFRVPPPKDGFGAAFIRGNPDAAIAPVPGYENLRVLLPSLSHMAEIDQLGTERVERLFATLRGKFDVIVVDSAPATEVSDALLLASTADLTIIAVRIGYTRRSRFDALRESLAQYGVTPAGLVVTTRQPPELTVHGSTMPVPVELRAAVPRNANERSQTSGPTRIKRTK